MAVTLALAPGTAEWFDRWSDRTFYLPFFVITLFTLLRTMRHIDRNAVGSQALAILASLAFRWGAGMLTYLVIRPCSPSRLRQTRPPGPRRD